MDTTEFQNQPWFSNNDYLEHFLDSIGYPAAGSGNRIVGAPQVRFWIHIKFWIYRDDNGNGGPTVTQIQTLMDDLNRRYNQTNNAWIGFYMKCDPTYINNSTHVVKTFTGASILMAANNDNGSINVHIIGSFASTNTAGFSIPFLNASMIPSGAYLNSTANGDLAHEIGHVLGLQHTHQYSSWNWKCLTECVSRTRTWPTFNLCPTRLISNRVCEATGDGLRDTQADDNLVSNNACFYNVNFGNDEWGDSYDNPPAGIQDRPNFRNIMSYNSATNCVDQISRLQIGVMLWTLYFKKTNNLGGWADPISTFDDFEPDNNAEMTININRHIQINQVQERNFHQQWNRVGGYGYTTQCDVDWVRFVAPCSSNFEVFTAAMPNRTNANTRLTLFDNNLVQLAQNDNISPTNLFSSIQFNFIAGREYFIRVENMSNLTTGYYTLQIGRFSITGNPTFCTSDTYSVLNMPAGATVTWNATPSGAVSFNPIGPTTNPTTTATRQTNGNVTIQAAINNCGNQFLLTLPVTVGNGANSINFTQKDIVCEGRRAYFFGAVQPVPFATNYEWYSRDESDTGNPFVLQQSMNSNTADFPLGAGDRYYTIRVIVTTPCGTIQSVDADGYIFAPSCSGLRVMASPNPTYSSMNVQVVNEKGQISTNPNEKVYKLEVVDKLGIIRKQYKFKDGIKQTSVNISNLPSDIYILRAFDGTDWISMQIIKN
jgi:hypothetical protein